MIKIQIILLIVILSLSSCTIKTIEVDDETKKICRGKKYNGSYKINLIRKCKDSYGSKPWGEANLEINQCVLSVNDLFGANLQWEPDNVKRWKSLSGVVDKEGRISGSMYLKVLTSGQTSKLLLSGNIKENKFIGKWDHCTFIYNLEKIADSIEDQPLEKTVNPLDEKPPTIIVPTGILGEISENQKIILEKTLESKIDDYFAIVPKDLYEKATDKAFEELDYDECTEEQCIIKIQELLQVENAFKLLLVRDGKDTQISLTWNNLDEKRVEEFYCENCNTKKLRETIEGIVEKLVKND